MDPAPLKRWGGYIFIAVATAVVLGSAVPAGAQRRRTPRQFRPTGRSRHPGHQCRPGAGDGRRAGATPVRGCGADYRNHVPGSRLTAAHGGGVQRAGHRAAAGHLRLRAALPEPEASTAGSGANDPLGHHRGRRDARARRFDSAHAASSRASPASWRRSSQPRNAGRGAAGRAGSASARRRRARHDGVRPRTASAGHQLRGRQIAAGTRRSRPRCWRRCAGRALRAARAAGRRRLPDHHRRADSRRGRRRAAVS